MQVYKSGTELKNGKKALSSESDTQIQNVQSVREFLFSNDTLANEENINSYLSNEMCELRTRKSGFSKSESDKLRPDDEDDQTIVDKKILDGDTLQNISLRYGCPVSELKRVNNLITDQDFFALKSIKVPVKRFGLVSELLAKENETLSSIKTIETCGGEDIPTADDEYFMDSNSDDGNEENRKLLIRTLSIRDAYGAKPSQDARDFLKHMDEDLENIRSSTNSYKNSLEEVANTLTCRRIYPIPKKSRFFNGADCGLRWWSIVLIMLVIGLLTPLLIFFYIELTKPPD